MTQQCRDLCLFQAIIWLLELCDVALQTQVDVSHDTKSVPGQQAEQRKLEETAKVSTRGSTVCAPHQGAPLCRDTLHQGAILILDFFGKRK